MRRWLLTVTVVLLAACSSTASVRTAATSAPAAPAAPVRITSTTASTTSAPSTTSTTVTPTTQAGATLHKVMIVGDSIMFVTSKYQEQRFRAAGLQVVNESFPGTSVLGRTNVTPTFRAVVAEEKPDVVIAEYSGVYLPPYPKGPDGLDLAVATPAWWDAWAASAAQATRDLASQGARVYWVLLPHDRITWANHDTRMDDLYAALAAELPNVGLIDWRWAVSGVFGAPVDRLPIGPHGALAPVRGADGFHFSEPASDVLAGVTVATVLHDYGR